MAKRIDSRIPGAIAAMAIGAVLTITASGTAFAAGGGDSTNTNANQCRAGKVWDQQKQKCVPKSSRLDQESIFNAGRSLAYAGDYDGAIELLSAAPNRSDARVLNMMGYANRKLGNREIAMAYYKHSIAVDPNYALVREYFGKALLEDGDVPAAREQLARIAELCGTDCGIYAQLDSAITAHIEGLPLDERDFSRW